MPKRADELAALLHELSLHDDASDRKHERIALMFHDRVAQ